MSPAFWVLLSFTLLLNVILLWPSPGPTRLRPSPHRLCAIPVEEVGHGVRCLTPAEAAQRVVTAGDVVPMSADGVRLLGPPQRMSGQRQLALGLRIDLNRATEEELIALPDVGPALAQAILAAQKLAPLRSEADLLRVRGIGPKRIAKLRPYLMLTGSQ